MEPEVTTPPSILKVSVRYGVIMALISIVFTLLIIVMGQNPYENSWWRGLISVAITVVVIILAQKYYKDNGDGFMTYGQGFGIAMLTCVISLVISFIFNLIYMKVVDPGAMDKVMEASRHQMEDRGTPEAQIEMSLDITRKFFWAFFVLGAGFFALLLSLIVSIFTQKKKPESGF